MPLKPFAILVAAAAEMKNFLWGLWFVVPTCAAFSTVENRHHLPPIVLERFPFDWVAETDISKSGLRFHLMAMLNSACLLDNKPDFQSVTQYSPRQGYSDYAYCLHSPLRICDSDIAAAQRDGSLPRCNSLSKGLQRRHVLEIRHNSNLTEQGMHPESFSISIEFIGDSESSNKLLTLPSPSTVQSVYTDCRRRFYASPCIVSSNLEGFVAIQKDSSGALIAKIDLLIKAHDAVSQVGVGFASPVYKIIHVNKEWTLQPNINTMHGELLEDLVRQWAARRPKVVLPMPSSDPSKSR